MAKREDVLERPMREANAAFEKMRSAVEEEVSRGITQLNVADIAKRAGLEIDERILHELQVDPIIYPIPWLPWHHWWPWRPLWCWWWHRYYPWYRCCPWWWHRCHWYHWA